MDEKDILKKMGLTDYESQIVLALLHFGSSKVGIISKGCSVPKNKIYESIQSLLRKGIVKEIPSVPKKYFIKDVRELESLIDKKQEEVDKIKKDFAKLKKIRQGKHMPSMNEPIGIIYGHQAFENKLKESMQKVSKENLILMEKVRTNPTVMRLTKEAIKRGAKIRLISKIENKSRLKKWKNMGVKIRYLDNIPDMTFSIFDDKLCRLNLNIKETLSDPTLWIENKPFINLLRGRFESLWKKAKK